MIKRKTNSITHLFISYSHEDKDSLQIVLGRLAAADIPFWYDEHLEPGSEWRPEIDDALKDAFAILVIVTPSSMKSLYVTYEWSWALGSSTPVFPLLMKGSYDDIHSRLRDAHCVDCQNQIPETVIEAIRAKQTTPPDLEYLNDKVRGIIAPLRVQIPVVIWLYEHIDKTSDTERTLFGVVFRILVKESSKAERELRAFLVERSHAFTTKQKQRSRAIIEATSNIAIKLKSFEMDIDRFGEEYRQKANEVYLNWLKDFYNETWLPAMENLDEKYAVVGSIDDYLYEEEVSSEEEKARQDYVFSLIKGYEIETRDAMDQRMDSEEWKNQDEETTARIAYSILNMAYSNEEKIAQALWEFIGIIRDEQKR
ncbi:MAG: hypothetical protein BroJett018_52930 [Chloroflexota bacterium]|nr:MAG: hypothetical protein BroJett018_52930 [Chloroflexota bacterium]